MHWCIHDLWGHVNLVASTITELDDTLPYLQDVHGIVCGPPTDARRVIVWKTCTRVRWAWLDSLIVIMNCCHSWCLRGSCVLCCHVVSLARCKLIRVAVTLSDMSDTCSLSSFRSNATSFCYVNWGWCWLLCSKDMIIINCWLSYLCMFSVGCKLIYVNQFNLANNMLKSN
jgi:hypothetical protein